MFIIRKASDMTALFLKDVKTLFGKGRNLIFVSVFFAVLFAAALLFKKSGEADLETQKIVRIGVINHDTSVYSEMVTSMYLEGGFFTSYVSVLIEEEEEIYRRFEDGELDMYVEIPEDFADSMVYLEHLPVQVVISTRNTTVEIMLRNLMESYAKYISAVEINCVSLYDIMLDSGMSTEEAKKVNERFSIALILRALAKNDFFEEIVLEHVQSVDLASFFLAEAAYVFAAFLAVLCGVVFQKEHHAGILRRLGAIGVNPIIIVIEKQIFFDFIFTVLAILGWSVLRLSGVGLPFLAVAALCAAAYFLVAVMLFFAALFQKMQNYLFASNLFLIFGAVFGGGIIPYMYFPGKMAATAKFFPNYWYLSDCLKILSQRSKETFPVLSAAWKAAAIFGGIFLLSVFAAAVYRQKGGKVENV